MDFHVFLPRRFKISVSSHGGLNKMMLVALFEMQDSVCISVPNTAISVHDY